MITTFEVKIHFGKAVSMFWDWACIIDPIGERVCNITLFGQETLDRFKQATEEQGITYKLVKKVGLNEDPT